MDWIAELEVVGAAACAMLLGGVIGYERELKNRPAGFRTHMLVAGAAALLVGISQLALANPPEHDPSIKISVDPLRLVEAVINGVAFIGAGTIFARRAGAPVAGITTAACASACIRPGMCWARRRCASKPKAGSGWPRATTS